MSSFLTIAMLSFVAVAGPAAESAVPGQASAKAPNKDINGDTLPAGAIARIGTARLKCQGPLGFSPDGKRLVSIERGSAFHWDSSTGALIRRVKAAGDLDWHREHAMQTALSKDTTTAAFGTLKSIHLWHTGSGQQRLAIPWNLEDSTPGLGLALSADGGLLAATADVWTVRNPDVRSFPILLWNARTGRRRCVLAGDSQFARLSFTRDSRTLLAIDDQAVIAWEVASGRERFRVQAPKDEMLASAEVSADGKLLAVCSAPANGDGGCSLSVHDMANGKLLPLRQREPAKIGAAAFSPDGRALAFFQAGPSGGEGLLIYDRVSGQRLCWIPSPGRRYIRGLVFAPDGKTLAGWPYGSKQIHLWDLTAGREVAPPPGHDEAVTALIFLNHGSSLLARDGNGVVKLWNARTGALLAEETKHAVAIASTLDRKTVGSLEYSDHMRLWDAETGKILRDIDVNPNRDRKEWPPRLLFDGLALASSGRALLTVATPRDDFPGPPSSVMFAWDTPTGKLTNTWKSIRDHIALFSPDGRLAVSRTGVVRQAATGKEVCHLRPEHQAEDSHSLEGGFADAAAFSRDGRLLAAIDLQWEKRPNSAPRAHYIGQVWELATRQLVFAVDVPEDVASHVVFSNDGRILMSGGSAGMILWDTATGQRILQYRGSYSGVTSIGLSLDGNRLATGFDDTTALVWDVSRTTFKEEGKTSATEPKAPGDLNALWRELASTEARRGQAAVWALVGWDRSAAWLGDQLRALSAAEQPAGRLREIRALQALEAIATPEAVDVLKRLAKGAPGGRLTLDAKESLERALAGAK